jgi:hypothetical protein
MVWGCMGCNGVGILQEVEGIMDKHQYINILAAGVAESRENLGLEGQDFYFQQDNDPKHTSKLASNGLMTIIPLSLTGLLNFLI